MKRNATTIEVRRTALLKSQMEALGATPEQLHRAVRLYTVQEVADHLRASEGFVRTRIAKGKIKTLDLAERGTRAKIRVREDDLHSYLDSCS